MTNNEFISTLCQEFELAFLATGLRPVRRSWGDRKETGCMLTALDVSIHGNREPAPQLSLLDMKLEVTEILRLTDFFAAKYPQMRKNWWYTFVCYCMSTFDGSVTFPARWLQRNGERELDTSRPKLFGAAVGGLVQRHVFAEPVKEQDVQNMSNRKHRKPISEKAKTPPKMEHMLLEI